MFKFLLLVLLSFSQVFANLEIEDSKVVVRRKAGVKDVIMISDFKNLTNEKDLSDQIRYTVKDLLNTRKNIFTILSEEIDEKNSTDQIDFTSLKAKKIDYIVTGNISYEQEEVMLNFSIWDVYEGKRLTQRKIPIAINKDLFSKQFATLIYEFITGDFGFFYGKLMYTLTERPGVIPFKKVVISYTNDNLITANLFSGGTDITFNPKYCKNTREMLYVNQSRKNGNSFIITDVKTFQNSKIELPFEKRMIIFSPNFSKDCNQIIFSVAHEGATNIYIFNRNLNTLKQLTNTASAINTSASFFANDSEIIFISDRTGKPKVWKMNADGTKQSAVLNGEGGYYSPSVSSDNKKIAFVKVRSGTFSIGTADITGENEKIIHESFLVENPVWAPIGKTIIFSMKNHAKDKSRIYAISTISNTIEELIALEGDLNEPKWIDEF